MTPISTATNVTLTFCSQSDSSMAKFTVTESLASLFIYLMIFNPFEKALLVYIFHRAFAVAKAKLFSNYC
jgi:hypothetical protein